MTAPLLRARDLRVESDARPGRGVPLVEGVDLDLRAGRTLALLGENGAGKTLTALALLGLVPPPARVTGGTVAVGAGPPVAVASAAVRDLRGGVVGWVPQDPASAFTPVMRVGAQIAETIRAHEDVSRGEARRRAREALAGVGVPRDDYPHRLSGGQRQRAMIAMALSVSPRVLVADEPTAALDATLRRDVLDLIAGHRRERDLAVLLITHDLGVVAHAADDVVVMRAGRTVERGPTERVLPALASRGARRPMVPAARRPTPRGGGARRPASGGDLLQVHDLRVAYPAAGGGAVAALDGVSLRVGHGESLAVVGESGAGKSTLARVVAGAIGAGGGTVSVAGIPRPPRTGGQRAALRRSVQMVFQDPRTSFDPHIVVGESVMEPLVVNGEVSRGRRGRGARHAGALALLDEVGLPAGAAARLPGELSGGELQRAAIARALALRPRLLVLDEPISALDARAGAAVMRLLADLRRREGLAYLLVAHDLALVRAHADRVAVMEGGRVVEEGATAAVFGHPRHPHTRALLAAMLTGP